MSLQMSTVEDGSVELVLSVLQIKHLHTLAGTAVRHKTHSGPAKERKKNDEKAALDRTRRNHRTDLLMHAEDPRSDYYLF